MWRGSQHVHGYVLLLAIAVFLPLSKCQRPGYTPAAKQLNRIFHFASNAPLTKAINKKAPAAISHSKLMLDYLGFVEAAILQRISSGKAPKPEDPVRVCGNIPSTYTGPIDRGFGIRGFPVPALSCFTNVEADSLLREEPRSYTPDDLYEAVRGRGIAIQTNVESIATQFANNFTTPDFPANFEYSTKSADCFLHPVCAVRVGQHWYLDTGLHNKPKDDQVPYTARLRILEYARVKDGRLGDNLLMRLPERTIPRIIREDTTTLIGAGRGSANPSCWRFIPRDENLAVTEALGKADIQLQQAQDAVTPSNIAILVLPLGLNLIPIAMIADVSTGVAWVYTLMSDVLTVIPLFIKGLELIVIAARPNRSVFVRMGSKLGGDGTPPPAVSGEIWAAECRARGSYGKIGALFVALSVTFLIIGVAAEFLARRFVRRRRLRHLTGKISPNNAAESVKESSPMKALNRAEVTWIGTGTSMRDAQDDSYDWTGDSFR